MADIFISYASEDRNRVEVLANALKDQDWSVFWDRTIPVGKTWDEVIEEEIDAAWCIVVVWSKKSVQSEWVRAEAEEGRKKKILAPTLIEDVMIPLLFRAKQAADLKDWQGDKAHSGFTSLLAAISDIIEKRKRKEEEQRKFEEQQRQEELKKQAEENRRKLEKEQQRLEAARQAEEQRKLMGGKANRRTEEEHWYHAILRNVTKASVALALIVILSVVGWFLFSKYIIPASLYSIRASSDSNGKILPAGVVSVTHGKSKSFEIRPSPGYRIKNVFVDHKPVEPKSSYTFEKVTSNHTIDVTFVRLFPASRQLPIDHFPPGGKPLEPAKVPTGQFPSGGQPIDPSK